MKHIGRHIGSEQPHFGGSRLCSPLHWDL